MTFECASRACSSLSVLTRCMPPSANVPVADHEQRRFGNAHAPAGSGAGYVTLACGATRGGGQSALCVGVVLLLLLLLLLLLMMMMWFVCDARDYRVRRKYSACIGRALPYLVT